MVLVGLAVCLGLAVLRPQVVHAAQDAAGLVPDTVLTPRGAPRLALFRTTDGHEVVLRLSVPVAEATHEAGAAAVLAEMARSRVRIAARRLGARVRVERSPWALVYTVAGSDADFDQLSAILRAATGEPEAGSIPLQRAVQVVEAEATHAMETALGSLTRQTRAAVCQAAGISGGPAVAGTPDAAWTSIDPRSVRALWSRTHRPARMELLAATDLPIEVVLAATRPLGNPDTTDPGRGPSSMAPRSMPLAAPQVLRHWFAEAHSMPPRDPRTATAGVLLGDLLRTRTGPYEASVHLLEDRCGAALMISGAAYRANANAMRSRLRALLGELEESLDDAAAADASRRVRARLTREAASLEGLLGLTGRFLDASGDVEAAASYVRGLESMDAESLRSLLAELRRSPALTFEVRP